VWGVKRLIMIVAVFLIGLVSGYELGAHKKPQPAPAIAAAVDCYDSGGKLQPDPFAQFGGFQASCKPGETAKPKGSR
jgi:hypothetical protein